ncbi:MAG TPA: hypothetical protein VE403_02020 [Sphingomicrobium sp.]|jgi:hypothetical protein|nr:hypothetical protein [Sphingomicrobium sp.]
MKAVRLFAQLSVYYLVIGLLVYFALSLFPAARDYLPVGGVEELINQPQQAGANGLTGVQVQETHSVNSLGDSLFWLSIAIIGAFLTALPVSWTYMSIRNAEEYDQSLISTILILPLIVTGIVVIVQNSLALAFSLAGIAGAVRFKNSLKSSGDALFILLSVGIGLSAGIGAVELAVVMSVAFNYGFLALWFTEYGEREGMKRYMSDFEVDEGAAPPAVVAPVAAPPAGTPAE